MKLDNYLWSFIYFAQYIREQYRLAKINYRRYINGIKYRTIEDAIRKVMNNDR